MDSLLKEKNDQMLYFNSPVILFFTFEFSGKGSSFLAFSSLKWYVNMALKSEFHSERNSN